MSHTKLTQLQILRACENKKKEILKVRENNDKATINNRLKRLNWWRSLLKVKLKTEEDAILSLEDEYICGWESCYRYSTMSAIIRLERMANISSHSLYVDSTDISLIWGNN